MARLSPDQWAEARRRWEADPTLSFEDLAETVKVSRQAVSKKAKADGWTKVGALRQVAEKAQLKADGKVAKVAGATTKKGEAATFDDAVDIRADVIDRHRSDWAEHRKLFPLADIKAKFELGKSAKITAEMMAIRQKAERAAYGLEETGGSNPPGGDVVKALGELIEKLPG